MRFLRLSKRDMTTLETALDAEPEPVPELLRVLAEWQQPNETEAEYIGRHGSAYVVALGQPEIAKEYGAFCRACVTDHPEVFDHWDHTHQFPRWLLMERERNLTPID